MGTTEERIFEIAEKLEAEGVNPTQVTVREALGGGSFATIGPVLKKWKESKKQDDQLAEVRVPEAITERLEALQGAVWSAAVAEADGRLTAERQALQQAQEAAAAEVREHLDSIAALEAEAGEYQRKIEALETQVAELMEVKAKAEADRHEAAEKIITETGRKEAAIDRAERAENLNKELTEKADEAIKEAAELRGEIKGLTAKK